MLTVKNAQVCVWLNEHDIYAQAAWFKFALYVHAVHTYEVCTIYVSSFRYSHAYIQAHTYEICSIYMLVVFTISVH